MLRPALVITILAAALLPAAAAQARPVDVPAAFGTSKLSSLDRKTPLPILLPDSLDLDIDGSVKVYASGSAGRRQWDLSLAGARRCGANVCFLASFTAQRSSTLGFKPNATLRNGIRAYFRPLSCGGSCAPPFITWKRNNVVYQFQAKTITGSKAEFVALANSAIAAGGRP